MGSPARAKIAGRFMPASIVERKAALQQTSGYHATALQNQFAFRAEEPSPEFDHPVCRREPNRYPPHSPESPLKLRVGKRRRRCQIYGTMDLVVIDQPQD